MANTTFNGPVRSENGFDIINKKIQDVIREIISREELETTRENKIKESQAEVSIAT